MIDSSPTIRVVLFAGMAEAAGIRAVDLAWTGGTVGELRHRLAAACPAILPLLANSAVAIGDRFATDDEPVAADDDVAIVPPVSGG
jgi:MoaE-MoaD fusion protein